MDHPIRICSGRANQPLAQAVAHLLGEELLPVNPAPFPDSESHIQVRGLVRHQDIYVIQPCSRPVNDHLMELLLMIDAFRRASANAINVIVPYFPYARQERMAHGREAISAKVVARMIQALGATRVIYVDIHAQATQGFFDIPVDPLTALPVLAARFLHPDFAHSTIVSPDVGRTWLASKYANWLNLPMAVMYKRREEGKVEVTHIAGDIKGHTPIIIDDIIASGSLLDELPALESAGARPPFYVAVTHPVLLPGALARLDNPLIAELAVTDTIYVPPESRHPKLRILSIAPLLAEAIRRIHSGETVGPLVEGTRDVLDCLKP